MMKIKLTKFERIAGVFLLLAILGTAMTALSVAAKQGWFETKTYFTTTFASADGIHQGTLVQMAGLRAGAVEKVELLGSNRVRVNFYVLGQFEERIRKDSQVQLLRPFLIGERVLDVSVGSETAPKVAKNEELPSMESMDLMTLMSGKKLNTTLEKFSSMLENLQSLAEAFLDKSRTDAMIRAFDRVDPLMKNLNAMSLEVIQMGKQLNHDGDLQKVMGNLAVTTNEINKILPALNQQNPELARDLGVMTQNLALVTQALGPAMKEAAPEMPHATHRLIEALNETVVVLKAMQKSFFFRGNVREVREEEASQTAPEAAQRKPANSK